MSVSSDFLSAVSNTVNSELSLTFTSCYAVVLVGCVKGFAHLFVFMSFPYIRH